MEDKNGVKHFSEIQTIQYLGSKTRILDYICTPILKEPRINHVLDLFAGSASIGYALKNYRTISSNDIELYSYIINCAVLNGCNLSNDQFLNIVTNIVIRFDNLRSLLKNEIATESRLMETGNINDYTEFCSNTPSVFTPDLYHKNMVSLGEIIKKVIPGKGLNDTSYPYILFLTYYANTYFGIRQCAEIDAICSVVHEIPDNRAKNVLLCALMSVLSKTASTTTHFAQYLKINGKSSFENIVSKRSSSIILMFIEEVKYYSQCGLLNSSSESKHKCYNEDGLKLLKNIDLTNTLVYADPPYFKEHYSRYYHILNTICLYDYPSLDINPQRKVYSIGRYRSNRNVSDFGRKAQALSAFEELIKQCSDKNAVLYISYSDNSIVKEDKLQNLIKKYYDLSCKKIPLNHSKQGRSSVSKVNELLFICRPQK